MRITSIIWRTDGGQWRNTYKDNEDLYTVDQSKIYVDDDNKIMMQVHSSTYMV